jgi:hypothetical protein
MWIRFLAVVFWGLCASNVYAYTEDSLIPFNNSLQPGTGLIHAGVGLSAGPSALLNVDVPVGVQVKQVLLYWMGQGSLDAWIGVNGLPEVRGARVGYGPMPLHAPNMFRADVTSLGFIKPGRNTLTFSRYRFGFRNLGAHVVVVVDDGSGVRPLVLRDGVDVVYGPAPAPASASSVEQMFQFEPACVPRASVLTLAGGGGTVGGYDEVHIQAGEDTYVYTDQFKSSAGQGWDVLRYPLVIKPGVRFVKVWVVTRAVQAPSARRADLLSWSVASLEEPCAACADKSGLENNNKANCMAVNNVSAYQEYAGLFAGTTASLSGYFLLPNAIVFNPVDSGAMLNFNELHLEVPKGAWTTLDGGWFQYTQEVFERGLLWTFQYHPQTGAWHMDYFSPEPPFIGGYGDLDVRFSIDAFKSRHVLKTDSISQDFLGHIWLYDEPVVNQCGVQWCE